MEINRSKTNFLETLTAWCSRKKDKVFQVTGEAYVGVNNIKTMQDSSKKTLSIIWERPLNYESDYTTTLLENTNYNVYLSYGIFSSQAD